GLECAGVDGLGLEEVDGAADIACKAGVEQVVGVIKRGALGEGGFDRRLVDFPGAEDAVVRPDRLAPFPFLDDIGESLVDKATYLSHLAAAPVGQVGDTPVDQFGWCRAGCEVCGAVLREGHGRLLTISRRGVWPPASPSR